MKEPSGRGKHYKYNMTPTFAQPEIARRHVNKIPVIPQNPQQNGKQWDGLSAYNIRLLTTNGTFKITKSGLKVE